MRETAAPRYAESRVGDVAPGGTEPGEVEVWKARYEQVKAERDTLRDDIKFMGAESEHDSALAFLARQVRAAQDASHRELYAPASYTTHDARVAWADGYTQACVDIRAAMKEASRG